MSWDHVAAAYLRRLVVGVDSAGVTTYIRDCVQQLWRANVERFDPDAIYDDNSTLGYTAARNVSNRIHAELRGPNGALRPGAYSVRENQTTIIKVAGLDLHVIKARGDRGRAPRFTTDFEWEDREGRYQAARRNADAYEVPPGSDEIDPLFDLPVLNPEERIRRCRDVFVVWGGDQVGRTSGWLGIPTLTRGSWLAVQPVWSDEDGAAAGSSTTTPPATGGAFSDMEAPAPAIALKRRRSEGNS